MNKKVKNNFERKYFFTTLCVGVGFFVVMFGTVWGLVMTTDIAREYPFLKKLFITSQGDFSSAHTIDLDENGIKIYNTTPSTRLIKAPAGTFTYESMLTGNSLAFRAIDSRHIQNGTLQLDDFGIPMITNITGTAAGSCPPGQVMKGIINGAPSCVVTPSANGGCSVGFMQGATATGLILCATPGGSVNPLSSIGDYWHKDSGSNDIYYGDIDDMFGNVSIGTGLASSKLTVVDQGTGIATFVPEVFNFTPAASSLTPKPCPFNTSIAITSQNCMKQYGMCGSANGQALTSAPTTNLCLSGNPSSVNGAGPWTWTCLGVNGGGNSPTCSAIKMTNGQCGSANGGSAVWNAPTSNLCTVGTPSSVGMAEGGIWANFNWTCAGSNGGSNATCSVDRIVHGKCPNRLAFNGTNPLGLTYGNQNSRAACQGINWYDPYMYVINYTNVIGNSNSSAVYYTCQGINGGQPSGQCTTYRYAGAQYSMCGSAAGGTFSSTPTSNLCYWDPAGSNPSGSIGSVSVVSGPGSYQWYKWTCQQYGLTCSSCTTPGSYEQQTCYARKQ